jgi:competence protein CoiA
VVNTVGQCAAVKYAILNNQRVLATKGGKGKCPHCDSDLIAKCGDVNRHHWSHKTRKCDDHLWENETDWQRHDSIQSYPINGVH